MCILTRHPSHPLDFSATKYLPGIGWTGKKAQADFFYFTSYLGFFSTDSRSISQGSTAYIYCLLYPYFHKVLPSYNETMFSPKRFSNYWWSLCWLLDHQLDPVVEGWHVAKHVITGQIFGRCPEETMEFDILLAPSEFILIAGYQLACQFSCRWCVWTRDAIKYLKKLTKIKWKGTT